MQAVVSNAESAAITTWDIIQPTPFRGFVSRSAAKLASATMREARSSPMISPQQRQGITDSGNSNSVIMKGAITRRSSMEYV
mmetsp:Transcript_26181/g.62863  ORF Transcript_26181/g.62863 Transcript_26181/m.62863 type:complete len:82 (+) Transcript_26181:670-915(+)